MDLFILKHQSPPVYSAHVRTDSKLGTFNTKKGLTLLYLRCRYPHEEHRPSSQFCRRGLHSGGKISYNKTGRALYNARNFPRDSTPLINSGTVSRNRQDQRSSSVAPSAEIPTPDSQDGDVRWCLLCISFQFLLL